MFRIGYIDDDKQNILSLKRQAKRSSEPMEIVPIELESELDETVTSIINSGIDAIVVDFNLKDYAPHVNYNGVDIVNVLNAKVLDFPTVILTAYETDAEHEIIDINIIYDKERCFDGTTDIMRKIRRQVENYRKRIEQAQAEISDILSKESLTGPEEKRLIELDEYLEKTTFKQSVLPKELKTPSSLLQLSELVNKAEALLKEVKKR